MVPRAGGCGLASSLWKGDAVKRKRKPKLIRLGVYALDNPDEVRQFGPYFTDSADDRDTMKQVIDSFNEDQEGKTELWCMAAFPAQLETVAS
jgi:hypothetical protein